MSVPRYLKIIISIFCLTLVLSLSAQEEPSEYELAEITAQNVNQIQQVNTLGYGDVWGMAWSPDGSTVTLAGSLGLVFYDAELFERAPAEHWELLNEIVFEVAYSPDGAMIATLSGNRGPTPSNEYILRLWDTNTQTIYSEWMTTYRFSENLMFNTDSTELVLFNRSLENVLHWDVSNPTNVIELEPETWMSIQQRWYAPNSSEMLERELLVLSPDGTTIAYFDPAAEHIHVVDMNTGESKFMINSNDSTGVGNLLFSPNSQLLVGFVYMGGGGLKIWDANTGDLLYQPLRGGASSLAFHPTESALIFRDYVDTDVNFWRVGMNNSEAVLGQNIEVARELNAYTSIDFNADGSVLAVIHGNAVEFWDARQGIKIRDDLYIEPDEENRDETRGFSYVEFSPDGRFLVLIENNIIRLNDTGTIYLLDTQSYDMLGQIDYVDTLSNLAFSPDGEWIATYHSLFDVEVAPAPNVVRLWSIDRILEEENTTAVDASIWHSNLSLTRRDDLAFSPDSNLLAITAGDIELWDVSAVLEQGEVGSARNFDNSARVAVLENRRGYMIFSPDGSLLVSTSNDDDCYLVVTRIESDELVACLGENITGTNPPQALIFLSDTLLISGAEAPMNDSDALMDILIWDIETESLVATLEGHFENYNAIAVSPDNRMIVSAGGGYSCSDCPSQDGALRVWGIPIDD